jgi:ABC-type transport system involved in multi-copper enzyme maturation permease subunit
MSSPDSELRPKNPEPPRRGWWPPLGPPFYFDLVSATRRGQHSFLRSAAALLLLATLLIGYGNHVRGFNPLHPFADLPLMEHREPQQFAAWFLVACLVVQVAGVFLVAPMVVADVIARERENRTLDFLHVTPLRDWEIVGGKLFSRLAYLFGALLAGLPVVAMTQLFGGVDFAHLGLGYAAIVSCLFVIGALGVACSVSAPTVATATIAAYGAAAGYAAFFLCCLSGTFLHSGGDWDGAGIVAVVNIGLGAMVLSAGIGQLRPRARQFTNNPAAAPKPSRAAPSPPPSVTRRFPLPAVYDNWPLVWRELNQYSSAWRPESLRAAVVAAVVLPILTAAFLFGLLVASDALRALEVLHLISRALVAVLTVLLGCLAGIVALRHAAASVAREREKGTLAALMTLPIDRAEILAAKWLGGFAGWCPVLIALVGVIEFGLITGSLSPLRTIVLIGGIAAPLGCLASLGLCLSVSCRTTMRANLAAVFCLLTLIGAPLLIASAVESSEYLRVGRSGRLPDWIATAALPPIAWIKTIDAWPESLPNSKDDLAAAMTGSLGYAVGGWLLWRGALRRFRRLNP